MKKTIKKYQNSGPALPKKPVKVGQAKQINASAKREAAKVGPKKPGPALDTLSKKQVFEPMTASDSLRHKLHLEKLLRDMKENENLKNNPYGRGKSKLGSKVTKKAMYGTMAKYGAKKVVKKKK